jgi:hypothetical protein
MGRSTRRLVLACAAASFAAPAPLHPVTFLEIENPARGEAEVIALREGLPFSVQSQHSIYDQPVIEEFVLDGRCHIVLKSVSSPSAAVREYFGIASLRQRHAVERAMEQIVFRVAMGTPQRLNAGGLERSFLEFGDHGDRLIMRAMGLCPDS